MRKSAPAIPAAERFDKETFEPPAAWEYPHVGGVT
jgi:hypothetical protein